MADILASSGNDSSQFNGQSSSYRYFDDDRHYQPVGSYGTEQNPKYLKYRDIKPNTYKLNDEIDFWFDGETNRVKTSRDDLFIQRFVMTDFGETQRRLVVNINGSKIQFSRANNSSLDLSPPKDTEGRTVWIFEQIGAPLKFITTFVDQRMGISRPAEERKQILTNASKFKSRRDQEISIELVTGAFKRYGGFFGSDAIFARETPGAVEFSKELQESILNGELLSG